MHIITVMDYHNEPYITMCKSWLYFIKRFNSAARITIFYNNDISEMESFAKQFTNISFIHLNVRNIPTQRNTKGFSWPHQELKLSLWKKIESLKLNKFIYIDADALVLGPLNQWWELIDDKPFIAIYQTTDDNELPFFNAGVFSYSSTNNFISYDRLINRFHLDGNQIMSPTGDQGILNSYFRSINYDCTHHKISYEYNCFAKNCIIKSMGDEIRIYSGNYPVWKKLFRIISHKKIEWWENWFGWNKNRKVIILHAYGDKNFKFWNLPECKPLWQYCLSKFST